ncbi:MAG: DUF6089 family protein [Bacteroidota bacterium]
MRKLSIALFLLLFPLFLLAQDITVGGGPGISFYQGDVSSDQALSFVDPNIGFSIFAKKQISTKWAVRVNGMITSIGGDDLKYGDINGSRLRRGYAFESSLKELVVRGEWNFIHGEEDVKSIHPFFAAGLGMIYTTTESQYRRSNGDPGEPLSSSDFAVTLPISIGITFDLPNQIIIGVEATNGFVFSDNLDGLSDPISNGGNDGYNYVAVSFGYVFGDGRYKGLGRHRFGKEW